MTGQSSDDKPPERPSETDPRPDEYDPREWARWFRQTEHPFIQAFRELVSSTLIVILIGVLLVTISGVWPPLVAVESGSMEPHMSRGDLVFVVEKSRFAPPATADTTGIVTYRSGKQSGYRKFGSSGDVIVYQPNRSGGTPIIHRARFWVNESENWYDKADPAYVDGETCRAVSNCPAPQSGFITKGDANSRYDQVMGLSGPVRPEWITGKAIVRIPWLGYVRLVVGVLVVAGG